MSLKSRLARNWARQSASADFARSADPIAAQRRQLDALLAAGADTAFGRDHGLAAVRDLPADDANAGARERAFVAAVPTRDYEALRPYLDRAVAGEQNVLWPGLPKYFCKTSGTTSGAKYIPITKDSLPNHIGSARRALLHHIHHSGNAEFVGGKMIFLQGSPALEKTPGGTPMGRLSGIVAHHVPRYLQAQRLPSWSANLIEDWERKVDVIVEETATQDMRLISGIPSWIQMYFERLLEHTGAANIKEVFPNFSLFVFGGVALAPYADRFRQLIGEDVPTVEIYPASEGFIAYQAGDAEQGLLLNVDDGIHYGFVPVDRYGDPDAPTLGLSEVEIGVQYALILSTNAGLWRYDIGDTVRFTSLAPARIVVTGRVKHFTSAFGEHVIAEEVEAAMASAIVETGAEVSEFHVAPEVAPEQGLPHHIWAVEFIRPPHNVEEFAASLDENLQAKNPYYRNLIQGAVLRPAQVVQVAHGAFLGVMAARGQLGGQNKIPRLANDRKMLDQILQAAQHV